MSFDLDRDRDLIMRLRRDGATDVVILYSDYQHLVTEVRRFYRDDWNRDERARFLLFMRGYSFFRELGENESEFWSNFFRELKLPSETKPNYPAILKALKEDTSTVEMIVLGGGPQRTYITRYVETFKAIWGIGSLNAKSLEKLFRRYYFQTARLEVDEALIRELLFDEPLDVLDRVVRQRASYNRIFVGLRDAIDLILRHNLPTEPLETLSYRVREVGGLLSEPNPIEFFRNKSERALRNLLEQLRGAVKPLPQPKERIQIDPSGHEDDHNDICVSEHHRQPVDDFAVEIRYLPGTVQYGVVVALQFQGLPTGHRVLRLEGATQKELSFVGDKVSFKPEVGETRFQVLVDHEAATRSQTLSCLPRLEWFFFDQRGERLRQRPLENQYLMAEVRLFNGEFRRVRWQARWDVTGHRPLGFPVLIEFDDLTFEVELVAEPHAIRFLDDDDAPLTQLLHRQVRIKHLPGNTTAKQRALLSSAPSAACDLAVWASILQPEPEDELIVERNVQSAWEPVGRIPLRLEPNWYRFEVVDGFLELGADAPTSATWTICEGDMQEHAHPVGVAPQQFRLRSLHRLKQYQLLVKLTSGSTIQERRLEVIPVNAATFLELELEAGLGWGRITT